MLKTRKSCLVGCLALLSWECSGSKYVEEFKAESLKTPATFSQPEQVTAGNESNFAPDLSPNGEYVVYTSDRKGNKDIWEKRTLGGFGRQLTLHSADDFSPVLSPNGKKLAFVSRRDDAAGDIHVMDLGFSWGGLFSKGEPASERIESNATEDASPAWFPESEKVIFAARTLGEKHPQLMTAAADDDWRPKPLGDIRGEQPAVAASGKRIAYTRDGAIFIYDIDRDKSEQITEGGRIQDGQPQFLEDDRALVFIRYADDTNRDGKLDGDDRPTIWRINLPEQAVVAGGNEGKPSQVLGVYAPLPLTAATFAAYSPQLRGPFLYLALQSEGTLNIFRLPKEGQLRAAKDLNEAQSQFDQLSDYYEKAYVYRRCAADFWARGDKQAASEAALKELDWAVQNGRATESAWIHAKLARGFPDRKEIVALADLALITLELSPVSYPSYDSELTLDQSRALENLGAKADAIAKAFAFGATPEARRVEGRAQLVRAKILAAQRQFFESNRVLASLLQEYKEDSALLSEAALYNAIVTPATADTASGLRALRQVVTSFPENRDVGLRAAAQAVALAEKGKDKLESLVALRAEAKGTPLLPALAHMRIAEIFLAQGKEAVAANELRQIVDQYPDSPELLLQAAQRLSTLEEKAGRYEAADETLQGLIESLAAGRPEHRAEAKRLRVDLLLHHGEALLKAKDPALARKEYAKVLALEPLTVAAYRGMIDAAHLQKDLSVLAAEYEERADASPDSAEMQYVGAYAQTYEIDNASSVSARLSAIDKCIERLEAARQMNGQLLHIHQTLGWLYMQKNFTIHQYWRASTVGGVSKRYGLVKDFFGAGDPDWRELAIDAFQSAYFLSRPESVERAGLAQNLGQAFFALKNYQKSLSYYMQRIRLLPVIPMRDPRAEAILLDRAGRSAFQVEELELAESLQRRALTAWETVHNEERIGYAIDALALTLRERNKYSEAIRLYDRLEKLQVRLGSSANRVTSLINLGYCAYMASDFDGALTYFKQGETELIAVDGKSEQAEQGSENIQVALGQGGTQAKGFDLFARRLMLLTFRAKTFEKLGRLDLALQTYEEKRSLLKQGEEQGRKVNEELAVLENNIGSYRLEAGAHLAAREAFREAEVQAKALRPKDQNYKSQGEVVNSLNKARVGLRLAALGILPPKEIEQDISDLDLTADGLRPLFKAGAKAEGRALAEVLEVGAAIKSVQGAKATMAQSKANLEESLTVGQAAQAPAEAQAGALLTYSELVRDLKNADLTAAQSVEGFRKQALQAPGLAWKVLAIDGDFAKAFEALDRYVSGGGALKSPTDRLAAREVFERVIDAAPPDQDFEGHTSVLLRRYLLLRHLELAQRGGLPISKIQKFLKMKETDSALAPLAENDAVLTCHRSLDGQTYLFLQTKKQLAVHKAFISAAEKLQAKTYEKLLSEPTFRALIPEKGGRFYVVPSADSVDVAWEEVRIKGERLRDRYLLSFIPTLDLLPDFYQLRRLNKATFGYIPGAVQSHPQGPQAASEISEFGSIQIGNSTRDVDAIPLDGLRPLVAKLKAFNIIHSSMPLFLNDVEPGMSLVASRWAAEDSSRITPPKTELSGNGAKDESRESSEKVEGGFRQGMTLEPTEMAEDSLSQKYKNDFQLNDLATEQLEETAAIVFGKVERPVPDLQASPEGHEGWVYLSLAALAADVPTVAIAYSLRSLEGAGQASRVDVSANWQGFYRALETVSVVEAAQDAKLPVRVLGYGGILGSEEQAYANEQLEKTLEEAEDAKADADFAKAAALFKRALYYVKHIGKEAAEGKILNGIVQSHYQRREFAEALRYKLKAAALLKPKLVEGKPDPDADPVDYGNAIIDAAVLAVRADKFAQADALLIEAEAIFTKENEAAALGKIWQYRGINYENQHRYEDTLKAYETARTYFAKVKPDEAANQLLNIGNVFRNDLSDYPKALENYARAADELKKLGKTSAYTAVLIDQTNTQMAIGDLEVAISVLERDVIPKIDKEKELVLWVRATQILANAYYRAGLFQAARDLNEQALLAADKIIPNAAGVDRRIDAMSLRGMIQAKLGQYKDAFETFRTAIDLATEFGLQSQLALLYNNYGFWAREYGAVDQSMTFFDLAKDIDKTLKSRSSIAFDDRNMGLSVILQGDFGRARQLLEEALKVSEELHLPYNAAYCHFGLADTAMRQEKWQEAAGHFNRALAVSKQTYMQDFVWRAYAGVAAASRKQGQIEAASTAYGEAIKVIEKLRAGLKVDPSRNAFFSDAGVQEVYEGYASVLMEKGQIEQAWQASERARARAFIDTLGTQKIRFARAHSDELQTEEKARRTDLEAAERKLERAKRDAKTEAFTSELDSTFRKADVAYQNLLQKIAASDAQMTEFVRVDPISKEELAAKLGIDTAMIEYQITPDKLLVWVLYQGKLSGKEVPVLAKDLLQRVKDFRTLVQNFSTTDYLGNELATFLLKPIAGLISNAKRLAIVPHGPLHFIPFAALPFDGTDALVDRFPVYYLESATLARYTHLPKKSRIGPRSLIVALANPKSEKNLQPLPFAGKEANVLGRYFSQVKVDEGRLANESVLRADGPKADILHLASHGEFLANEPAASRLYLAPAGGQDGVLSVTEIFGLNLHADLVTLSACDSGLGRLSQGDEIIGMNRAFFYAGANTVVSSLWRISDVASAVTMKRFYRYLSEGHDKAEAMRLAQNVVRRYFRHPAYWAGFKVLGSDQ